VRVSAERSRLYVNPKVAPRHLMFANLLAKEIREDIYDLWIARACFIITILFFGSALIQSANYASRVNNYSYAMRSGRFLPANLRVIFVPEKLSVFAEGLDVQKGFSMVLNPYSSLFPAFDFLYVVGISFSLLAILSGSVRVSREFEQGTLGLVLSYPISKYKIVLGKWISHLLLFASGFFIVYASLLVYFELDGIGFTTGDVLPLGCIFMVSVLYYSSFFILGVLISILCLNSSRAKIVALFTWIILVFVVPSACSFTCRAITHPPRLETINQKIFLVTQDLRQQADAGSITWRSYEVLREKEISRWDDYYKKKVESFVELSRDMMRVSPFASLIFCITNVTKTGIDSWFERQRDIRRYKYAEPQKALSVSLKGRPIVSSIWIDVLLLLVFNLIFFVSASISFINKSIRTGIH
jgi:ABC-type transport system involved in multi-copper enzyme maturation permease subunit